MKDKTINRQSSILDKKSERKYETRPTFFYPYLNT